MTSASRRGQDPGGEVGGECRRERARRPLGQRSLLLGAGDHPRHEVAALGDAAVEAIEARGADRE